MATSKNPIRIPFTKKEYETVLNLSKDAHLKKTTLITVWLLQKFEEFQSLNESQSGINLKYDADAKTIEITDPIYILISINMDVYEKIKKISDITNISVPHFCRYLFIAELYKNKEV